MLRASVQLSTIEIEESSLTEPYLVVTKLIEAGVPLEMPSKLPYHIYNAINESFTYPYELVNIRVEANQHYTNYELIYKES